MAAESKAKAVLTLKPQRDLILQILASLMKPEVLEVVETASVVGLKYLICTWINL
jgi:hypothetical protein